VRSDGVVVATPLPVYFRFGSNCDLRHRLALRLECSGEQTAALIETVMTAVQAGEIDKVLQGTKCYARQ